MLLFGGGMATQARGATEVSILLTGFGLMLAAKAWNLRGAAKSYRLGAIAEEWVGNLLGGLQRVGWLVEHDSPSGAAATSTMSSTPPT